MNTRSPKTETLSGVVDRVVYRNPETGYTVCAIKVPRQTALLTVVGNCAAIWDGETIVAEGQWEHHKAHGTQFRAIKMTCVAPTSPAGIRRYLASGMIDGIGPVLAARLVKKFGDKTLDVIERESARLESVEGIGHKRREQIKAAWNAQKMVRDIMIFLHTHGVGAAQANRIYRTYGDQAINLIRENPYRMAADIWGIGFKTADRIAQSVGIPRDSMHRAGAGIVYSLQTMTNDGHCYAERSQLLELAATLLETPSALLEQALSLAVESRALIAEANRIYLPVIHQAETGVMQSLARLCDFPAPPISLDVDKALEWAMARMQLEFAPAQKQALQSALTHKVMVITGGPGVGKTTIIKALSDIWHAKKMKICMAAPTGRAAKRMTEATGRQAMTIHRLLKSRPGNGFEYNQHNPLPGDIFILDETSMIDIILMHAFLRALPAHARLVLVGDADQLPSVGPGSVLYDILKSRAIPSVKLEHIFRQTARSWIIHNAHLINAGRPLELPTTQKDALTDFYFIAEDEPARLVERVVELASRRIPERFNLDPRTDIQVLSPMRKNQLGADALNLALQAAITPAGSPALQYMAWQYRVGDRIMQLRNNYDKNVYNGDIGFVKSLDMEARVLVADFDGQRVEYKTLELDEISLAYACSIHKSQGSEYPAVVILLATQHFHLLQRNLLYTAVTRGRQLVCLMGSMKAINIAIRNNRIQARQTTLAERLR